MTTTRTKIRPVSKTAANRPHRVSTAELRAQTIKPVIAKKGQETVYQTMKNIWTARGEITTIVKGTPVEVKKADVIRVLRELPRDAKSPFVLKAGANDTHILA